jgi:hypothetical protein
MVLICVILEWMKQNLLPSLRPRRRGDRRLRRLATRIDQHLHLIDRRQRRLPWKKHAIAAGAVGELLPALTGAVPGDECSTEDSVQRACRQTNMACTPTKTKRKVIIPVKTDVSRTPNSSWCVALSLSVQ